MTSNNNMVTASRPMALTHLLMMKTKMMICLKIGLASHTILTENLGVWLRVTEDVLMNYISMYARIVLDLILCFVY